LQLGIVKWRYCLESNIRVFDLDTNFVFSECPSLTVCRDPSHLAHEFAFGSITAKAPRNQPGSTSWRIAEIRLEWPLISVDGQEQPSQDDDSGVSEHRNLPRINAIKPKNPPVREFQKSAACLFPV